MIHLAQTVPCFLDGRSSLFVNNISNAPITYFLVSSASIILSTYPLPISGVDNIKKIYARYNSIGIFCWDNEKKLKEAEQKKSLRRFLPPGYITGTPYKVIIATFVYFLYS